MKINIKERKTINVREIRTIGFREVKTISLMEIKRINLLGGDIKDHALVERPLCHHGPVDAAAAHQHEVAGPQGIPFALHRVLGTACQHHDHLVKRMIIIRKFPMVVVRQVEQTKVLV